MAHKLIYRFILVLWLGILVTATSGQPLLPLTNKQRNEFYERIDAFQADFDALAEVKQNRIIE